MSIVAEGKIEQVRLEFEAPDKYLGRREFDIRIRRETTAEFARDCNLGRMLDIGCGNGAISIPLLAPGRKLTLLDLSSTMLTLAQSRIPEELRQNVDLVNEGFLTADLAEHSYDFVMCIGVMAHIDSPDEFLGRIAKVLKPGGSLILEFTDGYHPVGLATRLFERTWRLVRPVNYRLNHLWRRKMLSLCIKHGLKPSARYRYSLPAPGSYKIFSQETLYGMTRAVFGPSSHNRFAWAGNEYIYRLENTGVRG